MLKHITREQFYRDGGFANPNYCRLTRGGEWTYWRFT